MATVTTAWNEEAGAYTAQTAADALPYGTYAIQETKSNDSYLLTDGAAKTFQIRENGAIVKASSGGAALEFFDQVVRNDLEIAKMAEDTNESLQVAFKVTNEATGEAHVVVTDGNGNVSTASSWNKHSANTNGNDRLLDVGAVNASDMDSKAGVWFSLGEDGSVAEVDDGLAALPFGRYTLEELRSDSNEGYDLIKKAFVIERDSSVAKAVWMSLDDKEGPKVQTEATDASDGDHVAQASGEVTLSDTVYYENLKTDGTEYTVTGTLMLKSTGEALVGVDGNPVTASKTFRPKQRAGEVELQFAFDGSLLAGEDVVAFESLTSGGVEVAAHADIDDEGQTVRLVGIGTTATDKADGDKLVTGAEITIVDEVAYEGLTPGVEYTLEAALMDAEAGDPVTVDGKQVAGTATFAPDEADGVQAVELAFDGTGLGGKSVVVFEKLFAAGVQLAAHEDLSDEGQTVTVVEIGTKLTDAEDGDQIVASGKVKLVDTVEYKGLVPGETYTANGALVDKSTGETLVDAGGNPVTATAEFAPEAAEGVVEVAFEFDASHLEEGAALVAFERCLDAKGNVVAVHEDVDDRRPDGSGRQPRHPRSSRCARREAGQDRRGPHALYAGRRYGPRGGIGARCIRSAEAQPRRSRPRRPRARRGSGGARGLRPTLARKQEGGLGPPSLRIWRKPWKEPPENPASRTSRGRWIRQEAAASAPMAGIDEGQGQVAHRPRPRRGARLGGRGRTVVHGLADREGDQLRPRSERGRGNWRRRRGGRRKRRLRGRRLGLLAERQPRHHRMGDRAGYRHRLPDRPGP